MPNPLQKRIVDAVSEAFSWQTDLERCVRNQEEHRAPMAGRANREYQEYIERTENPHLSIVKAAKKHYGKPEAKKTRDPNDDRLFRLERIVADQQKKLTAQAKLLDDLREVIFPAPAEVDDYDRWAASSEASKYSGMHVAFVAGKGIIAADSDPAKLFSQIAKYPKKEDISISLVY